MNALFSVAVGAATVFQDGGAETKWIDGRCSKMSSSAARSIYRHAADAVVLNDSSIEQAFERLRVGWMKDRSLILTLLFVDKSTDAADRAEIRETLNEWLENEEVLDYVRFVLSSKPLPSAEVDFSLQPNKKGGCFDKLLSFVFTTQSKIQQIRGCWEYVADSLTLASAQQYEERLIAKGVFFKAANAFKADLPQLKFDCLNDLKEFQDHRRVISDFIDPLRDFCDDRPAQIEMSVVTENVNLELMTAPSPKTSYDYTRHVQSRLQLADSLFKRGDIPKAIKTVDWLVDEQLTRGDSSYAAKTLCNVSEMAKREGLFDLQLSFAQKAHEVEPSDERVLGHVGDAFLNLDNVEEAESWFKRAALSTPAFGLTGLARIYKKMGRFQEAYDLIVAALQYDDTQLDGHILKAELLRKMNRASEAVEVYSVVVHKFPYSDVALCGLGAAYSENCDYTKALSTYDDAMQLFSANSVPYTSKGHLLARLGNIKEALPLLRTGIDLAQNKEIAINALASALRMNGKFSAAIHFVKDQIKFFPTSEDLWCSLIESTISCGSYIRAQALISEAEITLRRSSILPFLRARLFCALGKYTSALEQIALIPSTCIRYLDVLLLTATIRRRLGQIDEARAVVESLLKGYEHNAFVTAEAVILGLIEMPENAVQMRAGNRQYAAIEDWSLDHSYSIALINRSDGRGAWRIALDGSKKSPFKGLKRKFGLLLAVARDILGRTGSIVNATKGYNGVGGMLIRLIAYWKLGLRDKISRLLPALCAQKNTALPMDYTKLINRVARPFNFYEDGDFVSLIEQEILLKCA